MATDENGALVRGYNHRWLHSLPPDKKEKINNCMLEFKAMILTPTEKGLEVQGKVETTFELPDELKDCWEIPVYDNTPEDNKKRKKFNRAKAKRDFMRQAEEDMEIMEDLKRMEREDDWER